MTIKVLLADDHGIMRQGLKSLLEKEPDIKVIAEANDGRKALELVRQFTPDVVIMDITMPNLNGVDATDRITTDFPKTKVIALSIHSNKRFVGNMLKAGASGYILKECLFDELAEAIRSVIGGDIYLSPRITDVVVDDYVKYLDKPPKKKSTGLSLRQREVLQLLTEGKTTKQIALELHISPKTVEANRRQVMAKLELYSIAELTKYALREGLTSLE